MDIQTSVEAVKAALAANQLDAAIRAASEAVRGGVEDPLVYNVAAHGLQVQRRYAEAMALLIRAARLAPNDPYVMISIGQLQSQVGRWSQAEEAFRAALNIDPNLVAALQGLGLLLDQKEDAAGARACFERAMALAPDFADPVGCLALQALWKKDFPEAETLARRALELEPNQTSALVALAHVERERGDDEAAEAHARRALARGDLPPLHECNVWRLLGDILDHAGRFGEAYEAYAKGNGLFLKLFQSQIDERGVGSGVDLVRRLRKDFEARRHADWSPPPVERSPGDPAVHVFLTGYFRSGTTLLEQVLASHPDVETMEEKTMLDDLAWPYFKTPEGLDRLAAISAAEVAGLRAEYWRRIAAIGQPVGSGVFVDKLPMATLWIPFIAKVFPEARILWARRDPRDVVLSCFRTRFMPGVLQMDMLEIARGAELYAAMMEMFEAYLERLPVARHVLRHEDLVVDFDAEVANACAFMGVDMVPQMRDFVATARSRTIRTPSASQVVAGLNDRGVGRWRGYAPNIEAALPILAPWVARFGYPAE